MTSPTTASPSSAPSTVMLLDRVILRPVIDSRPPADPPYPASLVPSTSPGPTLFDPPTDVATTPVPTSRSRTRLVAVPGSMPPNPACVDPLDWCRRLTPALVEVLHGRRPPAQLARWVDEPVLAAISSELRRRSRRRPPTTAPAVIHSVRVQCPSPNTVEASAHIRTPTRSCALAFQLRASHHRWLCTIVDVGDGAVWTP